jgi:hypothetical protein
MLHAFSFSYAGATRLLVLGWFFFSGASRSPPPSTSAQFREQNAGLIQTIIAP